MSTLLPDLTSGAQSSRLLEMLNEAGARRVLREPAPDLGLAEHLPFPFLAMVGQLEMRMALLLAVINPAVGGVLLIGPRGTGQDDLCAQSGRSAALHRSERLSGRLPADRCRTLRATWMCAWIVSANWQRASPLLATRR